MQEFSGLNRFGEFREGTLLYPLLEVTDTEDLQNLHAYRQAGDKLFIELGFEVSDTSLLDCLSVGLQRINEFLHD